MTHRTATLRSPSALPTALLALALCGAAVSAPAQGATYTFRNGVNTAYCGAVVGGPGFLNRFLTPAPSNDAIAVTDPGGVGFAASDASAQLTALPTANGIALALAGQAHRTAPPSAINAAAAAQDDWTFSIAQPVRFTLVATLSAASTESTVPPSHFTFAAAGGGAAIVPDPASPSLPYQATLSAPGSLSLVASGTLLPGDYFIHIFGRAEGTTFPFTGSYNNSLTLTLASVAATAARQAAGNPNSYTCSLPLLGQTWNAAVDVGSTGHGFAAVVASLTPGNQQIAPGVTALVGGAVVPFLPIASGPIASYSLALPANPAFAGLAIFTQAIHFGTLPTLLMSNACDLTLGF